MDSSVVYRYSCFDMFFHLCEPVRHCTLCDQIIIFALLNLGLFIRMRFTWLLK